MTIANDVFMEAIDAFEGKMMADLELDDVSDDDDDEEDDDEDDEAEIDLEKPEPKKQRRA